MYAYETAENWIIKELGKIGQCVELRHWWRVRGELEAQETICGYEAWVKGGAT